MSPRATTPRDGGARGGGTAAGRQAAIVASLYAAAPPSATREAVAPARHPADGEWGMLVRVTETGICALWTLTGALRSVPQPWARAVTAAAAPATAHGVPSA